MNGIRITILALVAFFFFSSNKCTKDKEVVNVDSKPEIIDRQIVYKTFPKDPYADLWKQMQIHYEAGKYKSAYELAEQIDAKAIADKNHVETLRALLAKYNLAQGFMEDAQYNSIIELEKRIKYSSGAELALLHLITGKKYWDYYLRNQYQINQRTQIIAMDLSDFRTWDAVRFSKTAEEHYLNALQFSDELRTYDIKDFESILFNLDKSDNIVGSLYDLMQIEVMDYFENAVAQSTDVENTNKLNSFFVPYDEYIEMDFSKVIATNERVILERYKDLLSTYHKSKDWSRVVFWDIQRLGYLNAKSTDIGDLYGLGLKQIMDNNLPTEETAMAYAHLATAFLNTPKLPDFLGIKPSKVHAKEFCESAIDQFNASSKGVLACKQIVENIDNKSLSFILERVVLPNEEAFVKLSYQNVDEVYFKIVPLIVDPTTPNNINMNYKEISSKPGVKEWSVKLKNFKDYELHTFTTSLPKMDFGRYMLIVSDNQKIDSTAISFYNYFYVSNLSLFQSDDIGASNMLVIDGKTGMPKKKIQLKIFENKYNYTTRNNELNLKTSIQTNTEGIARYGGRDFYNLNVLLINGKDSLLANQVYLNFQNRQNSKTEKRTNLFTDRAIYRPGQAVFFKGICYSGKEVEFAVSPSKTGSLELYDVNRQRVSTYDYKTNEFGSFTGSFQLPVGGLNGQFYLMDKETRQTHYFRVEEYKRPKFEAKILPLEGSYKLNEEVTVIGEAKAFSGQVVDGAKVSYRISESHSFPRWGSFSRGYYPDVPAKQIDFGELTTDNQGRFTIKFKAVENKTYSKLRYFVQRYTIVCDIVDITGETQTVSQTVSVANHAMQINIDLPEVLDVSEFKSLNIVTSNLNGRPLTAKGKVQIFELEEPTNTKFDAGAYKADYYALDSADWSRKFPNYDFFDENNENYLKEKNLLTELNFNNEKSTEVAVLVKKKLQAGRFKIRVTTTDDFGQEIVAERIFTLLDPKSKENPTNELMKTTLISKNHEPGQSFELLISSGLNDLSVLLEVLDDSGICHTERIELGKKQHMFSYKIKETQRGGIFVRLTSMNCGKVVAGSQFVHVPFTNKELDLKFESFRDKLKPGQEETWRIIIKGKMGDKVSAEIMATLYDASLDQFASNIFSLNLYEKYFYRSAWQNKTHFGEHSLVHHGFSAAYLPNLFRQLPRLNFRYFAVSNYGYYKTEFDGDIEINWNEQVFSNGMVLSSSNYRNEYGNDSMEFEDADFEMSEETGEEQGTQNILSKQEINPEPSGVEMRTNLNETAFFMPQLHTNSNGETVLQFTIPEALTRWKFISLAHTKDMRIGTLSNYTMTQKELMIQPNPPRFMRQGDTLTFVAKVSNLSEQVLTGFAMLEIFDAQTMAPIHVKFQLKNNRQVFALEKGENSVVSWDIVVPDGVNAIIHRVSADAGNFVDGEENMLPVLSNRVLVTESLPLPSKGIGSRSFRLEKLWNSGTSKTIKHESLTLEYTSNPAWYAVQAIPYLMEYPHECAEQLFSRFYANALASHIINANPKIKTVFEQWEKESPESLLSNLEKNQELKSLMLNETPWVMQAKSESDRKKRMALLFNFSKMERELDVALNKLRQMQSPNGGFPWFKGMPDNQYITQHIVMGAGHLDRLGIKKIKEDKKVYKMISDAVRYMDLRFFERYQDLLRYKVNFDNDQAIHYGDVQFLYARSFFTEIPMGDQISVARDIYLNQMVKYQKEFTLQSRAMIALCLNRYGLDKQAKDIVAALKDIAIIHDEMGMYWKDNISGYYWHQAPIETQAILIETFDEVSGDLASVEEMKIWLLKNKQTNDWKTTKATTQAVYALLMRGTNLLVDEDVVDIYVGERNIKSFDENLKPEDGTGYFKKTWSAEEIQPIYADVRVERKKPGVSWGALYWQYFEDLDKITPHDTPLKLKKQLFLVRNSLIGEVMMPIGNNARLKPGDKIRVRIELRVDRDMEFVHMKDMRAAGFEPVNVISQYKYQGGIGYYESTKDASTNFFIDFLRKGIYVFEYDLRANLKGQFANGITTIQCMYAPEFSSHSEGIRVKVE